MALNFSGWDRGGGIAGYVSLANQVMGNNNGCGNNNGLLGGLFNNGNCNDDCCVTEKTLGLVMANAAKDSEIAELKSEKYSDNKLQAFKDSTAQKFYDQEKEILELKAMLGMECERRACGDENIVSWVKGTYLPAEKYLNSKKIKYGACQPVLKACDPCDDQD